MYSIKRFLVFSAGIFVMATILCCAMQQPKTSSVRFESLRQGYDVVYYPKSQTGQTWDTVTNDLKNAFEPHPHFGNVSYIFDTSIANDLLCIKSTTVYKDRITMEADWFQQNRLVTSSLFFYNLLSPIVAVETDHKNKRALYEINLGDSFRFHFRALTAAQKAADALFFIQQQMKAMVENQNRKLTLFEPTAAQYRLMQTKPTMSEEQRRIIVEANFLSRQRKYTKAIEQYLKAVELNAVSYPAAYSNLALLSAQENTLLSAIFYMKHYLLLEPDAKDARNAQDKIYEWELMMRK